MQLESLSIQRRIYGPNEGKLEGEITFKNPRGKVQLVLNDEISQRLLAIVADGVVESSREIAVSLTAQVLTAIPAIEPR